MRLLAHRLSTFHTALQLAARNVPVGDFSYEIGVGVEQHDVDVLDGMNRLEAIRVLEPDALHFHVSNQNTSAMKQRH